MDGLRGFYRGMSASYAGISETVIHFVIYESIKRKLLASKARATMDEDEEVVKDASDFVGMMLAAATSKTCATSIAYPHGNNNRPVHRWLLHAATGWWRRSLRTVSVHLTGPTLSTCCSYYGRVGLSGLER